MNNFVTFYIQIYPLYNVSESKILTYNVVHIT